MTGPVARSSLLAWETANNLGNVLLRRNVITEKQLAEAVLTQQVQRDHGISVLLGQTLVLLGFLTPEQLAEAVDEQERVMAPPANEGVVAEVLAAFDDAASRAKDAAHALQSAVIHVRAG